MADSSQSTKKYGRVTDKKKERTEACQTDQPKGPKRTTGCLRVQGRRSECCEMGHADELSFCLCVRMCPSTASGVPLKIRTPPILSSLVPSRSPIHRHAKRQREKKTSVLSLLLLLCLFASACSAMSCCLFVWLLHGSLSPGLKARVSGWVSQSGRREGRSIFIHRE